jgi:predicted  nucleic acid-binding Zn-ribbon protein
LEILDEIGYVPPEPAITLKTDLKSAQDEVREIDAEILKLQTRKQAVQKKIEDYVRNFKFFIIHIF